MRRLGTGWLIALVLVSHGPGGCMALSPQLPPTDPRELEQLPSRAERERAFSGQMIQRHYLPQGVRYSRGSDQEAPKRHFTALDAILRSNAESSAALPHRKLGLARLFLALALVSGVVVVAGVAASASSGLDLKQLDGPAAILLGGGAGIVGFGVTSGVLFGRARKDYDRAVDIYNDSLGLRLGIIDRAGKYIPPKDVAVDKEGYLIMRPKGVAEALDPAPPPETDAQGQPSSVPPPPASGAPGGPSLGQPPPP